MGSISKKTSAERFIDKLNVNNAKLLALALVIGFVGYHGILHLRYGRDTCTWLLTAGRYKGDHEWQPYGCMLHRYSKTDARRCLRYLAFWEKHNTFAFIGDERLQQLYEYFIGILKTRLDSSYSTLDQFMPNHTYQDAKLRLSVKFIASNDVSKTMVEQFRTWQKSAQPPSVIVASIGLELLKSRNTTELVLEEFKRNLTQLVQPIDLLRAMNAQVLWKLMESVDETKLTGDDKRISNSDIDSYNWATVEILTHSAARLWWSPRLVASGAGAEPEGAAAQTWGAGRLPPTALRHDAQLLLNMYCNDHMNFPDGSCCAQPEPYTALQVVTFALFFACAIIAVSKNVWSWMQTAMQTMSGYTLVNHQKAQPTTTCPITALARLGMIMAYFYLCDRTNFFMKENKYYSEWSFWLPVGYVFAVGLFFTEESKSSRVLHREQTNEWKGWMQLVILVYQVTGASKVPPIHMLVRALASAYLFLTGYGHLQYAWHTGDHGLVRYLRVVFRLNFLTVVLCLTMNRPYQFYSFIPLVSFWFTLMYVMFALPPHLAPAASHTPETRPYQYLYLALKVVGLLSIVTVLYMSEVFFQKIFVTRPWKALFVNTDDDIHQWWLQWKQDRYTVAYGIMFGAAYLAARRHGWAAEGARGAWGALAGAAGVAVYGTFAVLCGASADCDEVHSYAAFLPAVSYVLLRNASGPLRARHSAVFAWVGAVSLELFASRSHTWLAADTHGVLVLVPGAPALNLLLTAYVFVCAAHEVRALTAALLPYAVPDDWRRAVRNVAVFVAVLVPIGVHDGMF